MKEERNLHPWGADEVAFLVRNHEVMSRDELAVVLGRTRQAVTNKLQRLGIKSPYHKVWTEGEDEVLRRGVREGASMASLARLLNVTDGQVDRRIDRLGLHRTVATRKSAAKGSTEAGPKAVAEVSTEAGPKAVAEVSAEGRPKVKVVEVRPKNGCKRPVYEILPLKANPFHMIFQERF